MNKPEQVLRHRFIQRCQAVFPDHIGRDTAKPLFARLGFGHGLPYQNGAEMQGFCCEINGLALDWRRNGEAEMPRQFCKFLRTSDEAYSVPIGGGREAPVTVYLCGWADENPERLVNSPRWLQSHALAGSCGNTVDDLCKGCAAFKA